MTDQTPEGGGTPVPAPPPVTVDRPTAKSEWTLFLALAAVLIFAAGYALALAFMPWPVDTAMKRIWFLGWGMLACLALVGVVIFAIASPWVGRVKASGPLGEISLDGR